MFHIVVTLLACVLLTAVSEIGQELTLHHSDDVNSVAYSPDGKQIVSGSNHNMKKIRKTIGGISYMTSDLKTRKKMHPTTVNVWNAQTGKKVSVESRGWCGGHDWLPLE